MTDLYLKAVIENENASDFDIASKFTNNIELIDDLHKRESELSLQRLLEKYDCQFVTLPNIKKLIHLTML